MKKYLSYTRLINGKFVFYKPYLYYIIRIWAVLNTIAVVLLVFVLIIDFTAYNICPLDTERQRSNYKNVTVKSEYNIVTEYFKNMSDKICTIYDVTRPEQLLADVYGEVKIFFLFETALCILYKYIECLKRFMIMFTSKYNSQKVLLISERRKHFLNRETQRIVADADEHIRKLLCQEIPAMFLDLNMNHQKLLINSLSRGEVYFNLKRFMFCLTWEEMKGNLPPFIDTVIYIRDILEGVQYLHDRKIYHLNICPKNILIVPSQNNDSGMAKISGFEFAIQSHQRVIDFQKVGLEWFYRPPEYFSRGLLDAKAVDAWSVGMTAYEVFTGGDLTIQSESMHNGETFLEFVQSEGLLSLSYFSSASVSCWNYLYFVGGFNNIVKVGDTLYNLTPFWFLEHSWKFVKALMNFYPEKRYSVSDALETPLITKVINPDCFFYVRCCRSQACQRIFFV